MMLRVWILTVVVLCIVTQTLVGARRRTERLDECVLFKSNHTYVRTVSESYMELGYYDIPTGRNFDITFDILPDRDNFDGPLFSIGTDNFQYYEWKTKAFKTQFLVIEIVYGALSMLLKALDAAHLYQVEIFRTFPDPYAINEGNWHFVQATREERPEGELSQWHLSIDDITISHPTNERTNVDLYDRPAYLGGRPGYRSSQFRGIIKNLRINGERVPLRGKATYGLTEVWHCSAPEVQKFIQELQRDQVEARPPIESSRPRGGWRRRNRGHILDQTTRNPSDPRGQQNTNGEDYDYEEDESVWSPDKR